VAHSRRFVVNNNSEIFTPIAVHRSRTIREIRKSAKLSSAVVVVVVVVVVVK
jgi:hypothetical protein